MPSRSLLILLLPSLYFFFFLDFAKAIQLDFIFFVLLLQHDRIIDAIVVGNFPGFKNNWVVKLFFN